MRLISSILFLAISALLFFFLIDPLFGDVKELRTNVSTYNSALSNSTDLQKTRDTLVEKYKQISSEDKDRLSHLLPSTINNIELILEIEKIANIHGMPISDIKFDSNVGVKTNSADNTGNTSASGKISAESDPSSYLPYGIFPVAFTIEGKYETFIEFLKDLENNLRIVDIKSVSFNVPEYSSETGGATKGEIIDPNIYKYSLKVETYWLK
ncbi:MAG: hypothetical protein EOM85_02095 [Candidatus Moranbacteria bacterium]|nr:hypothetical protein [Candidatus Moranbacteria bacterium]